MRSLFIALCLTLCAGAVSAQNLANQQQATAEGGVRPLDSADAAQPWMGVGRLDTGVSFCSATLISDRLVLTAAHCLYHAETNARLPDAALTFQAGLRNGRPEALRGVRRSHVPPGYTFDLSPGVDEIALDMALLELELPVRANAIIPLTTGRTSQRGDAVTVVSYGAERETYASIEEGCQVLEARGHVRLLSCDVVQGSSGAPVLRMTPTGPRIVAVISATAEDRRGRDVSVAVALDGPFAGLLDQMSRAPRPGGVSVTGAGVLPTLSDDGGRSQIGARFIRP